MQKRLLSETLIKRAHVVDAECFLGSGGDGSSEILAKDAQPKGGDVSERAGGDSGRHRAVRVC